MFDPPPKATTSCRSYEFNPKGERLTPETLRTNGPTCLIGVNLDQFRQIGKGALPCIAGGGIPSQHVCDFREDWTEAERAAWKDYQQAAVLRMLVVITEIPSGDDQRGKSGEFICPACFDGKVRWSRAPSNGHLRAACSTPHCCEVMQ